MYIHQLIGVMQICYQCPTRQSQHFPNCRGWLIGSKSPIPLVRIQWYSNAFHMPNVCGSSCRVGGTDINSFDLYWLLTPQSCMFPKQCNNHHVFAYEWLMTYLSLFAEKPRLEYYMPLFVFGRFSCNTSFGESLLGLCAFPLFVRISIVCNEFWFC